MIFAYVSLFVWPNITRYHAIPLVLVKGAKLLQWYYWFRMAISPQPLSQITWPKNQFVAKGLYFVCPHQSKVKLPQVFVVHFMHHVKVRHCNSFGGHCRSTGFWFIPTWAPAPPWRAEQHNIQGKLDLLIFLAPPQLHNIWPSAWNRNSETKNRALQYHATITDWSWQPQNPSLLLCMHYRHLSH